MTNKELAAKLNNLKNINPEESWLNSNRDLLLAQISNSGAENLSAWQLFVINVSSVLKAASQPAFALGAFVIVLLTGSLFSHQLFAKTKPNDSLYIARVISEKARLNTVFDSQERNKLAVQFAAEHAQDITSVLADPAFNNENNRDQIARLNESFNKEIATVKSHINYLKPAASQSDSNQNNTINENAVSIANSLKDGQGIELSENVSDNVIDAGKVNSATLDMIKHATATLTVKASSTEIRNQKINDPEADTSKMLDEAQKLFDSKDYNKALDKLKEVDNIIK